MKRLLTFIISIIFIFAINTRQLIKLDLYDILFALTFIIWIIFSPRKETIKDKRKPIGFFRRIGARYFDLVVIFHALAAVFFFMLLLSEYLFTEVFQWQNYQGSPIIIDGYMKYLKLLFLITLYFYHYHKHLQLNCPTIGQYIFGYQTSNNGGNWTLHRSMKRYGWSFLTVLIMPSRTIDQLKGEILCDKKTNTSPVHIKYAKN